VNSSREGHHSESRVVALIFVFALGLRSLVVFRTAVIFNDGPIFIRLAELMHAGDWAEALSHPYHPLYSFLIHLARHVTDDPERAGIVISLLGGSAAVVALYAFLREAFDLHVARVGAIMLALNPYAVRYSADVQSDSIHLWLFLVSVTLLYRALRTQSPRLATITGVVSGLAYLTRPEGVGVVLVGVVLVSVAWIRGSWGADRAARWLAGLCSGLVAAAVPYLLAIRSLTGHWIFSQKKSVLSLVGFDLERLEVVSGDPALNVLSGWGLAVLLGASAIALYFAWRGLDQVRGSPASRMRIGAGALSGGVALLLALALWLAPEQTMYFLAILASSLRPELVLLLVIGIGSRVSRGPQGRSLFISAFCAVYAVVLFGLLLHYGYLSRRHTLPPLSLLLGYAALGCIVLADQLRALPERLGIRDSAFGRWPRDVWLSALIVILLAVSLPKTLSDYRAEELAGRLAAEWLAGQSQGPEYVAANRSKLGYYARRRWFPLREEGMLLGLERFRRGGVRYVVIEEDALDEQLAPISPLNEHEQLVLLERHRVEVRGRHAVVFEMVERGTILP
jgi:4-amino-4-deoxy-L-arabinose transferase-like glycosyltransferase